VTPNDLKWKQVEAGLQGWAAELVRGLSQAEQRQAWLGAKALLRRPTGRPPSSPLAVESAFEASIQRLRAGQAGDELAQVAFGRLVREGYLIDRDESLASFTADLDPSTRLEVAALACFAHRQRHAEPREAVLQALRLAYDCRHHPEAARRDESAGALRTVLAQVEESPVLRHAVAGFVNSHMRTLDGLLGP
jgi:hypothetical protein